jgi:outer membrane protein insertion porin family
MKKIIVKLALIAGLSSASLTFSAPIKNIEILGLNTVSRGAVLSYLPTWFINSFNFFLLKILP